MAKTAIFTNETGDITSDAFTVTGPTAIDADFANDSDRLEIHRKRADGTFKLFHSNGPVILAPAGDDANDSVVLIRPGDYKVVGKGLSGETSAQREALP